MTGTQLELFPISALTEPADFIAPDTYAGRHTVAFNPRAYRVANYAAGELAMMSPEGVIYGSFGSVRGVEHFGRNRYVADGQGNLHLYNSDGALTIIHPATRVLRILTGK